MEHKTGNVILACTIFGAIFMGGFACGRYIWYSEDIIARRSGTDDKANISSESNELNSQVPLEIEEETESGAADRETDLIVFTAEDLPEEIKRLLNYENWIDDTQAISCTEEDIRKSGMPEEFQQILTGEFSNVQGFRNEEEREEMEAEYEKRESWAYMMRDMDRDA